MAFDRANKRAMSDGFAHVRVDGRRLAARVCPRRMLKLEGPAGPRMRAVVPSHWLFVHSSVLQISPASPQPLTARRSAATSFKVMS